jgi:hypothetical protein
MPRICRVFDVDVFETCFILTRDVSDFLTQKQNSLALDCPSSEYRWFLLHFVGLAQASLRHRWGARKAFDSECRELRCCDSKEDWGVILRDGCAGRMEYRSECDFYTALEYNGKILMFLLAVH